MKYPVSFQNFSNCLMPFHVCSNQDPEKVYILHLIDSILNLFYLGIPRLLNSWPSCFLLVNSQSSQCLSTSSNLLP